MTNKTTKPAHAPWVSPYITVKDIDKAIAFYLNAFHFDVKDKTAGEDGSTWHAELTYKGQLIMFGKEGAWGAETKSPATTGVASPITLYAYTDNVNEFYLHALAHEAIGVTPPYDAFWGDRMCQLKDADGYVWCFASAAKDHPY